MNREVIRTLARIPRKELGNEPLNTPQKMFEAIFKHDPKLEQTCKSFLKCSLFCITVYPCTYKNPGDTIWTRGVEVNLCTKKE